MPDRSFRGPGGSWAGGPSQHQKSYASSLNEQDALISAYEHLTSLPSPADALLRLRKIASLVKPIMRKRGWHVGTLAEFMPENPQLLGLNINHGQKICVRLRYTHNPGTFLPVEECVDTMLHELSHIVHGPHDAKFHALWDELRDEHETLLLRGFTGEGFLTRGHRLGGGNMPPMSELRRLARQNADNDRRSQQGAGTQSGHRLGGKRILPGQDARKVIADAIERRSTINRGCANDSAEADRLGRQTNFEPARTQSTEDDANDRAIAEALLELMEEEELKKFNAAHGTSGPGLGWDPKNGLYSNDAKTSTQPLSSGEMTEAQQMEWAMSESLKAIEPTSASTSQLPSPEVSSRLKPPPIDYASEPILKAGISRPSESRDLEKPAKRSRSMTPNTSTTPTAPDLAQALSAASAPFRPQPPPDPPATTTAQPPGPAEWPCDICTCLNPASYLICQACNMQRPSPAETANKLQTRTAAANLAHVDRQAAALRAPETMGWSCRRCGTFVEHRYWTCTACGLMKGDSRASEHAVL